MNARAKQRILDLIGLFSKYRNFSVVLFLFLFFSAYPASAGLDQIGGVVVDVITSLLQFAVVPLSSAALEMSSNFLSYVMSPDFNGLPLTHGGVVDVGWEITRQMANLFVIFFLIVFSFMSLLNIDDKWQIQKLVPRLIILAILINFTKVIAGVVVDGSQILMNFFISGGSGQQLSNAPLGLVQNMRIADLFSPSTGFFQSFGVVEGSLQASFYRFASAVFQIIFQTLTTWVFGILAVLFVMRVIAIWVLVILAPIAFLFGMLPGQASSQLTKWWTYLVQWAFVGSFAMFFVFLASVLAKELSDAGSILTPAFTPPAGYQVEQFKQTAFVGDLAPFMIYITILVFLGIGYNIAKNTSAVGADSVVKWVSGQQEKLARGYANLLGKGAKGLLKYGRGAAGGLAVSSGAAEAAVGIAQQLGAPGRYVAQKLAKQITKADDGIKEFEKTMKYMSAAAKKKIAGGIGYSLANRAAAIKSLADSGQLDPAEAARFASFAKRAGGETAKSMGDAFPHLMNSNNGDIYKAMQKGDVSKLHDSAISGTHADAASFAVVGKEKALTEKSSYALQVAHKDRMHGLHTELTGGGATPRIDQLVTDTGLPRGQVEERIRKGQAFTTAPNYGA